jgi:hypothetical protein
MCNTLLQLLVLALESANNIPTFQWEHLNIFRKSMELIQNFMNMNSTWVSGNALQYIPESV